jgi:uncharacterized protein
MTRKEIDEAARRVVLAASAREFRGRGGADARLGWRLASAKDGTRVSVATDLRLGGAVAQYGRGIVTDVASQLMKQFAVCIASRLRDGRADSDVGASLRRDPGLPQPISRHEALCQCFLAMAPWPAPAATALRLW